VASHDSVWAEKRQFPIISTEICGVARQRVGRKTPIIARSSLPPTPTAYSGVLGAESASGSDRQTLACGIAVARDPSSARSGLVPALAWHRNRTPPTAASLTVGSTVEEGASMPRPWFTAIVAAMASCRPPAAVRAAVPRHTPRRPRIPQRPSRAIWPIADRISETHRPAGTCDRARRRGFVTDRRQGAFAL
jgi:hypothetical protein